jgi:hypothetical protein
MQNGPLGTTKDLESCILTIRPLSGLLRSRRIILSSPSKNGENKPPLLLYEHVPILHLRKESGKFSYRLENNSKFINMLNYPTSTASTALMLLRFLVVP